MNELTEIIIFSLFSGMTILFGGLLAKLCEKYCRKRIEKYIIHWSIAFGGGILVAAVAFVLTPKGIEAFSIGSFSLIFLSGAFLFFLIDQYIEKKGGILAQTMAMLMDYFPEAIALGAAFAHDHRLGILLAIFIGLQNMPESFNAYFDLRNANHAGRSILRLFFLLSFIGVFAAVSGRYLLANHMDLTSGIMLFAGGGILYLIFQDIAPLSKVKNHWEPALGASLGFLLGMIGTKIFG